jgi:hypothetical protein
MIKKTGKIEKVNLDTANKNTWCPGCPNCVQEDCMRDDK